MSLERADEKRGREADRKKKEGDCAAFSDSW